MLYDFGCTQETVYEMMLDWNETHCEPPGNVERLAVVVESAGRNRDNAIGCKHPNAPGFTAHVIEEHARPVVGIPAAGQSIAGAEARGHGFMASSVGRKVVMRPPASSFSDSSPST